MKVCLWTLPRHKVWDWLLSCVRYKYSPHWVLEKWRLSISHLPMLEPGVETRLPQLHKLLYFSPALPSLVLGTLRSNDGDGNGNATKAIGLSSKQQFCTCITLFCTFLCRHCTTTTWKCLISRCTEEVHKRRRNFLSLSALGYGS